MEKIANIDIVLPAYNPPLGWGEKVTEQFANLSHRWGNIKFNLIIVDDGSSRGYEQVVVDDLKQKIENLTLVIYKPNRGKGFALREAVKNTKADLVIYTDYDFPYTNESIDLVVKTLIEGADVVVAVRDRAYQKSLPCFRKFLSYTSHWCNRLMLQIKVTDTQGGLKGFNAKGREVFLQTTINSFLFDTEFIVKATRKKLKIVPVESKIKDGIEISNMGFAVMRREMMNFLKILFRKA